MSHRHVMPRAAAMALIAMLPFAGGARAQLTTSAFTAYNPANASSIQPGLFSLYSINLDSLVPTQSNVGFAEVNAKTAAFNLIATPSALTADLLGTVEPVVIGPNGQLYQTDGHHSFVALLDSVWGAANPTVYVDVIGNYSGDTPSQFATALAGASQLYPFDNAVQKPVSQSGGNLLSPIPTSLAGLTNDPYRGLEYSVLKNKLAAGGVGHDKTPGYSDFMWADAYRNANGGAGLPYLTPANASAAAVWSMNGNNSSTLPGGVSVKVNQMPGYILPTGGGITVNGVLSNANMGTGALDGGNSGQVYAGGAGGTAASFTGLNGYTVAAGAYTGNITVQPHVTGLLLQLGSNNGGTVTLSGTSNTYTGGTTIVAGSLIVASDGSLGAAPTGTVFNAAAPRYGSIDPNNVANSVRAANGIVFESLSEGAATLTFGTNTSGNVPFATARDISIGQEVAGFNMNGNTVTLTGQLATSDLNTSGAAPLQVNDTAATPGKLILAPGNSAGSPLFYGNLQISAGTLQVASDAAMGATVNQSGSGTSQIGQVQLDGGTFQAGGSFSSVRNVTMTGGSTFDTNGFSTSFASLSDIQRTLAVSNSGATAGSVTFGSFNIASNATLALTPGTGGGANADTTVTFTGGITRGGNATLFLDPTTVNGLGGTTKVFSSGASTTVTNGMVTPWIIIDQAGASTAGDGGASANPYTFATYGANGYATATAGSTNIRTSTATQLVVQSANATLSAAGAAYALDLQDGFKITLGGNNLTIGNGAAAAGLIMDGGSATITGSGNLAFGSSEALIYAKGTNIIAAPITGTGGITLSGSGTLQLTAVSNNTGAVVVNSGTLELSVANALNGTGGTIESNVTLLDVKSHPSNAILQLTASNAFSSLNSAGNNSSVVLSGAGVQLTIGDGNNLSSTLSSIVTDSGSTGTAGAIAKNGTGLLDMSNGGSKQIDINAASTIVVTGGQLRLATNTLQNANAISMASGTELQFVQGGTGAFGSAISGAGLVHVESGVLQLTGTNTYAGGTTLEIGTTLLATTANLTSATVSVSNPNAQTITNAGGTLILDQTTTGSFTAVMSDGVPGAAQGGTVSQPGNFVKADSTGANGGNVTIANAQKYTGATTVEAGTLTLGATDTVKTSSGVTIGTVGGGATANLALGANNTVQGLNSVAGNTTGVQLNGHALTVQQTAGATSSFAGNISDTGAGAVNTTNGGTLALSGTNQIGGTVSVGSGTTFSQTGGSLAVGGNVTNNGTFAVNGTTASYGGTFTNNGTMLSDPSTQTFNNLTISATGSIQASQGDLYRVGGNFLNASTQNTTWNTTGATLDFYGSSGTGHVLDLVGEDLGTGLNAAVNNFAWGALTVDAGDTLSLENGLGGGSVAFYANDVIGAIISGNTITNILGDGFNIYYDPYDTATAYLGDATYQLTDGGELIPDANLPEPTSLALLMSGLAGSFLLRRRGRKGRRPAEA
jgi:autotransporter-associated beta strand protein